MIGGEYARWQGATWSRTDPDKLWVVPLAPNGGGSTSREPQIYTYSVSANAYSSSPVKSFVSLFTSSQVFFEYHFAGTHSGYSTANLIDMTNRRASIEVVQATNTSSWANTVFSLAGDNGWYRFLTEHGQLYMEQYVNGMGSGATPIAYSATTHRHWRICHDPSSDTVYWETSSDGSSWMVRHSATRHLDITRLVADLYVRTWQSESAPGVAVFDNFKFESNP